MKTVIICAKKRYQTPWSEQVSMDPGSNILLNNSAVEPEGYVIDDTFEW